MLRTALSLGVVAVLLATTGCTMCCHPYDYCGPVHNGCGCQSCSSQSRAGSILSGTSELTASSEMPSSGLVRRQTRGEAITHASLRNHVQGDMQLGDVPGSEQIVSVTDRVVDSSTSPTEPSQIAAEPAKPLPSQGWTARRPTPEVTR